ncbi:Fic family protein [Candidatus Poriferisodalis sp.]|uniref:Fic family protein n=1 Tax=Candidatus Poriferisodalis sp. TaxID=3101277 RepID=UPI003B01746F
MGRYLELDYTRWVGTSMVSSPFRAYVPCALKGWVPSVQPHVRELVRLAERRIADANRLDISGSPTLHLLLTRAEGLATSSVENIRTTMRSLSLLDSLRGRRRAETDRKDRLTLGSVHMNTEAMSLASRADADVSVGDIERLHRILFTDTEDQFDAGQLRKEQVWIGSGQRTPVGAHFVPPPHTEVPALMSDLSDYISDCTVWAPAVVKAAVVHAQFETIHPFTDGNGRIGRALTNLVLRRAGHLEVPVPLSAAIDARRQEYYDSLQESRAYIGERSDEGRSASMTASVEFTADAVVVACDYATTVAKCVADWENRCSQVPSRQRSSADEILQVMRTAPAATLPFLVERSGLNRRTAERAVSRLTSLGLLAEHRDHESGMRILEAPDLIGVADNRDALIAEAWRLHLDGRADIPDRLHELAGSHLSTPLDGPRRTSEDAIVEAAKRAADKSPGLKRAPRCGHIGARSHKPCQRRAGHTGDHAY